MAERTKLPVVTDSADETTALSKEPAVPDGFSRRDFFQVMGLSASAAMLACSRAPVKEVIPFLVAPDDITPGVAVWYASVCGACPQACGVLLKTRDGRPIKVEGNDLHPWSQGGVCAVGQASVLSLYDAERAQGPEWSDSENAGTIARAQRLTTWDKLDERVMSGLNEAARTGEGIRLVTAPMIGPAGEAAIARFLEAYPTARRVWHDPLGTTQAIARAHLSTHDVLALPAFHFERAKVIVSVGADFLGTWLAPVSFTKQYRAGRDPDGQMSRHFQLEPNMTVTGSNADVRWGLAPSDVVPVLGALAARLGVATGAHHPELDGARLDRLARELGGARGQSLVVTGSADPRAQALANGINEALGNYGATLSLSEGTLFSPYEPFSELVDELRAGAVSAVVFLNVNPVYSDPQGEELRGLLAKVALSVSTSDRRDETARAVGLLAPANHPFESWGDSEPVRGLVGLSQPAVQPLYDTRSAYESLLTWAGAKQSFYDFLRSRWEQSIFPRSGATDFVAFWESAVERGFATYLPDPVPQTAFRPDALALDAASATGELELVLHESVGLRDGRHANNGWLQELPDPIYKTTWGNVAAIAPALAKSRSLENGDVVVIRSGERQLELPVLVQPGQHPRSVAIAVGYGRTHAGQLGNGVGVNAFYLANWARAGHVELVRTGRRALLARTQTHDSMEGRPLALELPPGGSLPEKEHAQSSMWSDHDHPGHRWGMAIDLSACTGCSACLVACQAENNVHIVGADEVRRRREMHWIRIDRYYEGSVDEPRVVHQPMMCLHCDNAPCETVCPVLATVHSSEGLNQQVYNRCVGTRYCANNCPVKVRRFNWFDYPPQSEVARMVLNPDVAVRSRGVMEKCSLCVQRIQMAKATAKREGRALQDGEVRTACQQSCPAGAIVFGDLNDPESRVAKLIASGRSYRLLEELNIRPSVHYLARARNAGGET